MVVCAQSPLDVPYQDWPAVIVEIVSESTRRTDEQEERSAYFTIGTLSVYILLEQERAIAFVWRRGSGGFEREVLTGLDAAVPLPEIGAALPLAEAYAGLPASAAAAAG